MVEDRIDINMAISPDLASRLLDWVGMADNLDPKSKIGQIKIIVMDEVNSSPPEETFEIDEEWLDVDEAVEFAIDEMKYDWSTTIDEDLEEDEPMDERASIIAYITTMILNEWNHLRDTLQ